MMVLMKREKNIKTARIVDGIAMSGILIIFFMVSPLLLEEAFLGKLQK